jgi:hypothetical protein
MTEENFKEAKSIQEEIEKTSRKIRDIESIIEGCGISCVISATPKFSHNTKREVNIYNKELINQMLTSEIEKSKIKLDELNTTFKNL